MVDISAPGCFLSAGLLSVFVNPLDKYLYVMARAGGCWEAETRSLCFCLHCDGGKRGAGEDWGARVMTSAGCSVPGELARIGQESTWGNRACLRTTPTCVTADKSPTSPSLFPPGYKGAVTPASYSYHEGSETTQQ